MFNSATSLIFTTDRFGDRAQITYRHNMTKADLAALEAKEARAYGQMMDGINFEQNQMLLAELESRYPE